MGSTAPSYSRTVALGHSAPDSESAFHGAYRLGSIKDLRVDSIPGFRVFKHFPLASIRNSSHGARWFSQHRTRTLVGIASAFLVVVMFSLVLEPGIEFGVPILDLKSQTENAKRLGDSYWPGDSRSTEH